MTSFECALKRVPNGWRTVSKGTCQIDDMFWNLQTERWTPVEVGNAGDDADITDDYAMDASDFYWLIRKV